MNKYEQDILANIERHGCSVTSVVDPDGADPTFTYSIGITRSTGAPEVIVLGLSSQLQQGLVNDYLDRVRAGETVESGVNYDRFLRGFPVRFLPVTPEHRKARMLSAVWLYKGADFEALQMVWPDDAGVWPWEDAADDAFRKQQPLLDGSQD